MRAGSLGLILLAASPAHADEVTLRLDMPGYAAVEGRNWTQLAGGGLTWRSGPFEADTATDFWINPCVKGFNFTARGGVAPEVLAAGRWSIRVPLHGGLSYVPFSGGGCDQNLDEQHYMLSAAGGLEAVGWGPHKGFSLRALGFVGEQSYLVFLPGGADEVRWRSIHGFTISIGMALRL